MVRTRFAPSPTGSLHIGGLRTALFNYMYAKRHGGDFILRIEDTDQKRYDPNALQVLLESLQWAGLDHSEFYVQSERLDRYQLYAEMLLNSGHAYICTCTSERLEAVNAKKMAEGHNPGYDRYCRNRNLTLHDVAGQNYVVRLKVPMYGYIEFTDAIRGDHAFKNNLMNDPVLLKSDGFPTYHLAHVVDDYEMNISHVIRAVEWHPSTAIHLHLWDAFGWERPVYAHLPVLLNPTGKGKISKRNPPKDAKGNVVPVLVHDYINAGYLPDAVLNFLCNTGWNFGRDANGKEMDIFTLDEAIERFDLVDINPVSSRFPVSKLNWMNGVYIRNMGSDTFKAELSQALINAGVYDDPVPFGIDAYDQSNFKLVSAIAPLIQPRVKTMAEAVTLARPFFEAPEVNSIKVHFLTWILKYVYDFVQDNTDLFNANDLRTFFEIIAAEHSLKLNDVCAPVRYALSGSNVSVPLFETMEILGRDEVLCRIEKVL